MEKFHIHQTDIGPIPFIDDINLSWEEKGLIEYVSRMCCSGADLTIEGLLGSSKEGERYVRSILDNLARKGYAYKYYVEEDTFHLLSEEPKTEEWFRGRR